MYFDINYQKPGSSRFKLMIDGNLYDIDLCYTVGEQAQMWEMKQYLLHASVDVCVTDFVEMFPDFSKLIYDLLLLGYDPSVVKIHYF